MAEVLPYLMPPGAQPAGAPWIQASRLPAVILALVCAVWAFDLGFLVLRRKGVLFEWAELLLGAFLLLIGGVFGLEACNSAGRLAGLIRVAADAAGVLAMLLLLRITPKLLRVPTLAQSLAMDAELSSKQREKRQMEGELKESQDRFRTLVDSIRDYAIFMLDPEGRITSWNPGAERITGYAEGEVLGQNFARLFSPDDAAAGRPAEILRKAAARGRIEDEGWRIRKDGSRFLAHGIFTAFRDADGTLQGFAKITQDVTEQRANQTALENLAETLEEKVQAQVHELRVNEAMLQGFFQHAPAALAFKSREGRFLFVNPRMEGAMGRPAAEILGRTSAEVFPPKIAAEIEAWDGQVLREQRALQVEYGMPDAQGATRHYLTNVFPLVDTTGQGWGLGVIATDITERKLAERALLQTQKLESLGVLAGGIAHDFNNLLGAMQGNVELAMAEASQASAQPHLETLMGLMSKAADLLRQMLAHAGHGKAAVTTLDLNQLVGEMTQLLETCISKKVVLRQAFHPEPLFLEADPSQLHQVIMNLVINASEAIHEATGTITIRTRRQDEGTADWAFANGGQAFGPGPYAALEVTDTGAGMTPEVVRKIFDPFFTTKFAGRGLGLAAIHGIVRSHRGGVQVISEPGTGSTFTILFPLAPPPPPSLATPADPARTARPRVPAGTVLVIEDEAAMRYVVAKALLQVAIPTLQAQDGQMALRVFKSHREQIRLILMDMTMPNLDGEETLRELRRQGATVPVILTSGFNEEDVLERFTGLDLAGFIQKPFKLEALVDLVCRVMAGEPEAPEEKTRVL